MDSQIELEFLGGCRVSLGGRAVDIPFAKSRALLCFLVLNKGPHTREALAELLWGEYPEEDARTSLRARLSGLRRLLPGYFIADRDSIAFDHDRPYDLDVMRFREAAGFRQDLKKLQEAIDIYQGDFLEGFHVSAVPTFEAWHMSVREQLREEALVALKQLVAGNLETNDLVFAHKNLLRFLELDPWREESYRQLMRVLALQGRRDAAVSQYLACCRVLAEELGLDPSAETTGLYEKIRAGELQPRGNLVQIKADPPNIVFERRQLTVLSGALARISAYPDPEELLEKNRDFHQAVQGVVNAFGGTLALKQGFSFIAYFGLPVAYEDAPRRALHAATALTKVLSELPFEPQAKLGVHTGMVVIDATTPEPEVVGLAPIVARSLQASAHPGEILVSGAVQALVQGYFEMDSQGSRTLEEISDPIEAYQVTGVTTAQGRLQARPPKTAMVGRAHDLGRLHQAWQQAYSGRGRAILISGEAGIGKSRLLHAFGEKVTGKTARWLELQCSPYQVSSPFRPAVELIERELDFRMAQSDEAKLQRLESSLINKSHIPKAVMPPLAALLSLPYPGNETNNLLSSERQRSLVLEALALWLTSRPVGVVGPAVLIFEDLHWADPTTLELVEMLTSTAERLPFLLLMTARPDFNPRVDIRAHSETLSLEGLSSTDSELMIRQMTGEIRFPQALLDQLTAKGDGVPLYIEELTKGVLESDWLSQHSSDTLQVPSTLQDALTARLDRLPSAKPVAQLAAVIGKTFSLDLLGAVYDKSRSDLFDAIKQLLDASLIFRSDDGLSYRFKHALVRDAAYSSLLKSQARVHHARIAQELEKEPSRWSQPEILAQHFAAAGLIKEAILYWRHAASRASERSAQQEAVYHLRAAIKVLDLMPDGQDKKMLRIALLLGLGNALHAVRGYAVPEVEVVFGEARDLCQGAEASEVLFEALYGLAGYYAMRARYDTAEALMRQLFELPRFILTPRRIADLHFMASRLKAFQGELFASLKHAQEVQAISVVPRELDPQDAKALDFVQARSSGFISAVLWLRGYPEQASMSVNKDLAFADQNSDLRARASALAFALIVAHFRRDTNLIGRYLQTFMSLTSEQVLTNWLAYGMVWQGAQQAVSGKVEGLTRVRHGIELFDSYGTTTHKPYLLSVYASAQRVLGQQKHALTTLEQAIVQAETTGEFWWLAELYRLKGALLASMGDKEQARSPLLRALTISTEQRAKSLELRVATNLLQINDNQKRIGAVFKLREVYGWFTEGLGDEDLKEARSLL